MFHALSGTVSGHKETRLFLKSGAIEWELEVSERCIHFCLNQREVRLFTHLYVREDLIRIYGFESTEERDLFLNLISVNKVGPKLALRILSRLSVIEVWSAIRSEDIASLILVQGLGKKNAENIILALKDKAPFQVQEAVPSDLPEAPTRISELLSALHDMGYEHHLALAVLKKHQDISDDAALLKHCIAELSKDGSS